jgi:hypothetical protein
VAWWLGGLVAWWLGGLVAWWLGVAVFYLPPGDEVLTLQNKY